MKLTTAEAIAELRKVDTLDMPARLCEAHYMAIKALEQEPKTGHCKECKYFEYDSVEKVDGVPLIVAHEICKRWGDGCKTKEDGYCFLFEPPKIDVLDKIKAGIELAISDNEKYKNDYTQGVNDGLCHALHIISEYRRKSK